MKYINKVNQNKFGHRAVLKPEVITSRGRYFYSPSHAAPNQEPTQIHSCTRTRTADPALCPRNVRDPGVSDLISI